MFFKTKGEIITSALSGNVIEIGDVDSPIFAGKVVGDGVAITPIQGIALSPISGLISFVGTQKHSYGITGYDGVEVLLHIGIGTVSLNGEGFNQAVKVGDQVQAGDLLCTFDLDLIKKKGLDPTSPLVITSGSIEKISRLIITTGPAIAGKTVCMKYTCK